MNDIDYFKRPEVSNSTLSAFKNELSGRVLPDLTDAYAFGTLVDAMITEPDRIDWFRKLIDGNPTKNFELARRMYKKFMSNAMCKALINGADFQKISVKRREMYYDINGTWIPFEMDCRCKWDFFRDSIAGDIKTTAATSQKQFVAACHHFDYFRSRSWYMDLEDTDKDVIIGISKVNLKIFFIRIERGDELYELGKKQYQELAFKYWMLKN